MNIDRLLDIVNESFESTFDYYKSSAIYRTQHGHGVRLDRAETNEQRHIVYAYHANDRSESAVQTCIEVLELDKDQISRLYTAARAAKRWYNATKWERIMPEILQEKLLNYIMG